MASPTFIDHLLTGDHASRPAASAVPEGTLYSCTDHIIVYQSDTSSWSNYLNIGTAGISASLVDAKGDIIAATAADTVSRLAAGANDTVLMAASGEATGLKWGPGAWTSYAPALTAASVNPTLGTGSSAVGAYMQIGKLVIARYAITFGTSGTGPGIGEYAVSLPVNAQVGNGSALGAGHLFDSSTTTQVLTSHHRTAATTAKLIVHNTAGTLAVTDAVPWTWAASDSIQGQLIYEAA